MIVAFESSDPTIVRVDGRTRGALRRELSAARAEHKNLIVDLTDIAELEVRDVAELLACLRIVLGRGGDVRVCGLTPANRLLFEVTRLFQVIDVCASVEEARRAFTLAQNPSPASALASIFDPVEDAAENAA